MRIDVEFPEDAEPGRYGVYVLRDSEGVILYIGQTQNLSNRLRSHRNTQPWWRRVRSIEWVACDGQNEARVTEKELIAHFHPAGNSADVVALSGSVRHRLPDWTAARLVEMREEEAAGPLRGDNPARDRLDSYIVSLRQAGWNLAAIGEPMGMTRERVRQRQARALGPLRGACVPAPPLPASKQPKPKKVYPQIPQAVLSEMRRLRPLAESVRGWTPADAPERASSVRYAEMMAEQYLAGVSIYMIAKQLGVTHLAVRARLARHGYMNAVKGLPQPDYGSPFFRQGPRSRCKRDHSLDDPENVRLINGDPKRRVCRECERIRKQRYAEAHREAS